MKTVFISLSSTSEATFTEFKHFLSEHLPKVLYLSLILFTAGSALKFFAVLRIPDPNFFHRGSRIQGQKDSRIRIRIRIKEFNYFNPKNVHPGSGPRIRILIFYPSRIPGSKRHRIPDSDPQNWFFVFPC
jgi:hypothetical protein